MKKICPDRLISGTNYYLIYPICVICSVAVFLSFSTIHSTVAQQEYEVYKLDVSHDHKGGPCEAIPTNERIDDCEGSGYLFILADGLRYDEVDAEWQNGHSTHKHSFIASCKEIKSVDVTREGGPFHVNGGNYYSIGFRIKLQKKKYYFNFWAPKEKKDYVLQAVSNFCDRHKNFSQ